MDRNMCVISVVIPIYNGANEIEDTLKPLLKYKEKIEIIIINDASTDNTLDVLEHIVMTNPDSNIRVYTQEKAGVSHARNKGIELARGEYIYFCDDDDCIADELIDEILKKASGEIDLILWKHDIQRNTGLQKLNYKEEICDENGILTSNSDFLYDFLSDGFRLCMGTFAVRKSLLEKYSLLFFQDCRYGEDLEFIIKIILYSNQIVCIPEELFTYIRRDNSSMANYSIRRFDAPAMVLRLIDFINGNGIILDTRVVNYLNREYFIKQFLYSFDSTISHLKMNLYFSFWEDFLSEYSEVYFKVCNIIKHIDYDDLNYPKRRLYVIKRSIRAYSGYVMLKNTLSK